MIEITQELVKTVLHYDPETGIFRWRQPQSRHIKPWAVAGGDDGQGYISLCIRKIRKKAHRVAWLYITGEWPKDQIDHIDGDKKNNSWKNLRSATNKQNLENAPLYKSNSSGFIGASFDKESGKWKSYLRHNGKLIHIGRFNTAEEAGKASAAKRAELYTHYTGRDKNMSTCQTVSSQ